MKSLIAACLATLSIALSLPVAAQAPQPPEVAARESRCNKSMEVWSSERKGSDRPIDLSGKKKDL